MRRNTVFVLCAAVFALAPFCDPGAAIAAAQGNQARENGVPAVPKVSRDSLVAMVRFLSVDPASGASRTRFVLRVGPLGVVADSLAARLARYTGRGVDMLSFTVPGTGYADDSTFTARNIVARIAGTGAVDGVLLITAHYDAIALRTPGWSGDALPNWRTLPAPGADDNGTGVATVMEAARVLSGASLPFDVMFVLFSGEELDRLGSKDFVARYAGLYGERIIGVINSDMIGYRVGSVPAGALVSNYESGWLARMIMEDAEKLDPSFPLELVLPGLMDSDHGSFWPSTAAVEFAEPYGAHETVANPYYHKLADTLSWVDFDQVEHVANLVTGFVGDLATAPAEVALDSTDLALFFKGVRTLNRSYTIGDTITVGVRVRNLGAVEAPHGANTRLRVSLENARGSRVLYSDAIGVPGALDYHEVSIPIVLGPEHVGADRIRAAVTVTGMNDIAGNDAAELWIGVEGKTEAILMHAFEPNPIRKSFGEGAFCVNLSRPIDLGLELYNLEGERLGTAYFGARWGRPLEAGMNCLPLGGLFPRIGRLASGVYMYRLVVYEGGAARESMTGRFAVEH